MRRLTENEYNQSFLGKTGEIDKISLAYERAWKNRDYEIDKYWSRATYFWAFIAAAFVGFSTITASSGFDKKQDVQYELSVLFCALGLVFSTAWILVNIGSKKWQINWEKHIDLLENDVTGPLYKTVLNTYGFSVSSVNLWVSYFVAVVWIFIFGSELIFPRINNYSLGIKVFQWVTGISTFGFLMLMIFFTYKPGRSRSSVKSRFYFELRESVFEMPLPDCSKKKVSASSDSTD